MATLIPAISFCKFDTSGERRFARLLESKLEEDYLCWENVPIAKFRHYPHFIILHPQHGLLTLEVKERHLDTIRSITSCDATILVNNAPIVVNKHLAQARGLPSTSLMSSGRHRSQLRPLAGSGAYVGDVLLADMVARLVSSSW